MAPASVARPPGSVAASPAGSPAAFVAARSGMAAIEFALILPILLSLLYAGAELVNAIDHQRKVNQIARTLADLTSQGDVQSPISTSLMQDVFAASTPILAPYASADATMQVATVGIYTGKLTTAYICSSWTTGSTKRSVGLATDVTVPANYQRVGARYVLAEVKAPYKPLLGGVAPQFVKGLNLAFTWSETVSWPVRGGTATASTVDPEVVLPGGKTCP